VPIHDWTRVEAGIFHDFHNEWLVAIKHALNRQLRGSGYYALVEQDIGNFNADVLTLEGVNGGGKPNGGRAAGKSGPAVLTATPKARYLVDEQPRWPARHKQRGLVFRHVSRDRPAAVLEIVSPGNKGDRESLDQFVFKVRTLLAHDVNVSLVDLFPPTERDRHGIHRRVWGPDRVYRFDPAKPLTCAAYASGNAPRGYIEPVAVGDALPDLPVFLTPDEYVLAPLEAAYAAAFAEMPDHIQGALAGGPTPKRKRPKRP
jgi:hypothetical protein